MMDNYQNGCLDEIRVDVAAIFRKENRVVPVSFILFGSEYGISGILEETRSETLKKRGSGIRYKIRAGGEFMRESYLFRIGDLWYLAEQLDDSIPDIQLRHIGVSYCGKKVIDGRYDNQYKVAVDVAAMCYSTGGVEPYALWWEDGTQYEVDRILERERAASLKAGIIGMRYKVSILGRETYLFRDDDLWFMERKKKCRVFDVHGLPLIS